MFILVGVLLFLPWVLGGQTLSGRIVDAHSREGIPLVTVALQGAFKGQGTACDVRGNFKLPLPKEAMQGKSVLLRLSAVGYESKEVEWLTNTSPQLGLIPLVELSNELGAVVVRSKKQRYSKRNNPAVMLIERAIAQKDSNQLQVFADYSYREYEKILFSQVGVSPGSKYFGLSADVVDKYKDSSKLVGSATMPLSLREKQTILASREGSRLDPVITGRRIQGIEESMDEGAMTNGLEEVLGEDIDVYANNIKMLLTELPSPMNKHWATSFYKYYIKDTVSYEGADCYLMHFRPMNPRNMGFMGQIWIDTTQLSLRHVEMEMPRVAGINWVSKMRLSVDFAPEMTPRGAFWLPRKKRLSMILKPTDLFKQGLEVEIEREAYGYRFGAEALRPEYIDPRTTLPESERALAMVDRPSSYGMVDRPSLLTPKEQKAVDFRNYLQGHSGFKALSLVGRVFLTGYLPLPVDLQNKERIKFDLGPYETLVGYNAIEGWKFRLGGMTTAGLMQHLFAEGYVGYALGDREWKYYGKLTYTPRRCVYQVSEAPRNNLSFMATHETFVPGDEGSSMFKDGWSALAGGYRSRLRYYGDKFQLAYERDWSSTFSTNVWLEYLRKRGAGDLRYYQYDDKLQAQPLERIEEAHLGAEATWVFGRARLRTAREGKGLDITRYRPKITASVKLYPKGWLGNPTTYAHTALSYSQRLHLSIWGRLDAEIEAGAVWGDAPQTSLFSPSANTSWALRYKTFQTLQPLEYVADKYLRFNGTYHLRGLLFNRLPFIKRLRLREVLSLHGYWGHISERNRLPRVGVAYLPSTSRPMDNRCHLELGVGIENILSVLRVDYYYRLTDRHIKPRDRHALRLRLSLSF